jgi:hypothetical protein
MAFCFEITRPKTNQTGHGLYRIFRDTEAAHSKSGGAGSRSAGSGSTLSTFN